MTPCPNNLPHETHRWAAGLHQCPGVPDMSAEPRHCGLLVHHPEHKWGVTENGVAAKLFTCSGRAMIKEDTMPTDSVDHPPHYLAHPSGVECITITEHMNFNIGNAVKYLWRAGEKGDAVEDLRKADWYVRREIRRLGGDR